MELLGSLDKADTSKKKDIPSVLQTMHAMEGPSRNVLLCFKFCNYFKYMQLKNYLLLMELFLIVIIVEILDYLPMARISYYSCT